MREVVIPWISYRLRRTADEGTGAVFMQGWGDRTGGIQTMWGCPALLFAKSLASALDNREHKIITAHMLI